MKEMERVQEKVGLIVRDREIKIEIERKRGNYRKILTYTERRTTARKRESFFTVKKKYNGR